MSKTGNPCLRTNEQVGDRYQKKIKCLKEFYAKFLIGHNITYQNNKSSLLSFGHTKPVLTANALARANSPGVAH